MLNNLNNSVNFAKVNAGITIAGGTILGNVYKSENFYNKYIEYVWSSSENGDYTAWCFYALTSGSFDMGNLHKGDNHDAYSVRPVMAF